MPDPIVQIRLPQPLLEQLDDEAEAEDRSRSAQARRIIADHFESKR